MTPVVSVLVPTYNGINHLRECIESILAQAFGDFELLVVDDASDDGSADLAREYAKGDPRIRVHVNEVNLGLVGNWNRSVALAKGEWVKFVFQDDTVTPDCLSALMEIANRTRSPIAFGRRGFIYDERMPRETLEKYFRARAYGDALFPESGFTDSTRLCELILRAGDRNFVGEPVAVLFRSELQKRVGLFNPHLIVFCDMEYWMRVGVNTGIAHSDATVASFRIHAGSTTAKSARDRHYRMFVLDPLVVSHEFAYHPAYAPLRREARSLGLDLRRRFEDKVSWARGIAVREDARDGGECPLRLQEFRDLEQAYPRIRRVASRQKRGRAMTRALQSARNLTFGKWPR